MGYGLIDMTETTEIEWGGETIYAEVTRSKGGYIHVHYVTDQRGDVDSIDALEVEDYLNA